MVPAELYFGDIVQGLLVAVSAALAVVSVAAYRRRTEGRYLLLMLGFLLLLAVSLSTALTEVLPREGPAVVAFVDVYLNPSLELLMVVSFLMAALWSATTRRRLSIVLAATALAVGLGASALFVASYGAGGQAILPPWCSRPAGGFLIVASDLGYNDSISHGAPAKSWPIIDVRQGAEAEITVCNVYSQAVGFQVAHYLVSSIESIPPGKSLTVSFLANQIGSFYIYCSVLNPIHVYLQGGELNVS